MKAKDKVKLIKNDGVYAEVGSIGTIIKDVSKDYPKHKEYGIKMFEVDFGGFTQHVEKKQLEKVKEEK